MAKRRWLLYGEAARSRCGSGSPGKHLGHLRRGTGAENLGAKARFDLCDLLEEAAEPGSVGLHVWTGHLEALGRGRWRRRPVVLQEVFPGLRVLAVAVARQVAIDMRVEDTDGLLVELRHADERGPTWAVSHMVPRQAVGGAVADLVAGGRPPRRR